MQQHHPNVDLGDRYHHLRRGHRAGERECGSNHHHPDDGSVVLFELEQHEFFRSIATGANVDPE